MTNREWLQTLSDEDFAKWCLRQDDGFYNSEKQKFIATPPYPKLDTIRYSSTSSFDALLKWLNEERVEVLNND